MEVINKILTIHNYSITNLNLLIILHIIIILVEMMI